MAGGVGSQFNFADVGGTITNITAAGNGVSSNGIILNQAGGVIGTINNLTSHSNADLGMTISGVEDGTITGIKSWRNNLVAGLTITNVTNVVLETAEFFGNAITNLIISCSSALTLKAFTVSADTTFATTTGISFTVSTGGPGVLIENSTFGVVSGIKAAHTQDIIPSGTAYTTLILHNTTLASSTEVATPNVFNHNIMVQSQKHDQTAGLHKTLKRFGTITIDTTIFDVTPSQRLTPNNASNKLDSAIFRIAVASGQTLTPSVKVRESVAGDGTDYNGNRIRLMVKKNVAAGIAADTVLATATGSSEGAFQTISGTTAAVSDDAVLEFCIDCDGTTGWINLDSITVT
jgi:hypothetical protein